jgi:hypothetical protein
LREVTHLAIEADVFGMTSVMFQVQLKMAPDEITVELNMLRCSKKTSIL